MVKYRSWPERMSFILALFDYFKKSFYFSVNFQQPILILPLVLESVLRARGAPKEYLRE